MNIVVVVGVVVTFLTAIPVLIQLRSHPRGLFVLFFAEMWERFSYYGMRGLLIFYLTQQFLFDDDFAQGQYAAYTTLVYLLPLVGGMLADRWLGTRKAIAFGALLLVAGHFAMAIEGKPATQTLTYAGASYDFVATGRQGDRSVCLKIDANCYPVAAGDDGGMAITGLPAGTVLPQTLAKGSYTLAVNDRSALFVDIFYLALALIIMGVGFLKANISSIVGQLYLPGDVRRDPGFTLYYYGINLGAFWASILCGLIGQTVGWWAGFGLAGVGMLAGFLVFVWGKPLLEGHGEPPEPEKLHRRVLGGLKFEHALYLGGLLGVGVVWFMVRNFWLMGPLQALGWGGILAYFAWYSIRKLEAVDRDRLILAVVLIFASIVFFALFEQAGSSLNQFAERNTNLPNRGFMTVTPAQTQSFNAGFILIFAPVFAWIWAALGKRNKDPNPVVKFGLALIQVGAGFLLLVWGAGFADAAFRTPMIFLALAYLLHTTGELCLSPVGLSEMTKLAPPALISTVMATWFLASSAAQYIAGFIAQLTASETVAGQVLDPAKALGVYVSTFQSIGWIGVGCGVLMLAASPWLKKLAHGVK
ncbi:MAG TPA: oligopeptide:H+ symporter [Caulobacteraceae bacterium]|jgi:POT family proton-dependent oligopeptide transporter|nr:oligopeptide:H+ symporter [Caulobacteraceae bacterium]